MLKIIIIAQSILLFGCDKIQQQFSAAEDRGPPPLRIERVLSCNKYRTCVVVFANGKQGLMTSPKEGEYGCKSMSEHSYIRCDGP